MKPIVSVYTWKSDPHKLLSGSLQTKNGRNVTVSLRTSMINTGLEIIALKSNFKLMKSS